MLSPFFLLKSPALKKRKKIQSSFRALFCCINLKVAIFCKIVYLQKCVNAPLPYFVTFYKVQRSALFCCTFLILKFRFSILYWVWKHAKTIPLISAKKSVLRLIRRVYKRYFKFTIMLWDVASENLLLSYTKISTLIPKIMNYKFGVVVGGRGSSLPHFTTLIHKIMNSKFGGGGSGLLLPPKPWISP